MTGFLVLNMSNGKDERGSEKDKYDDALNQIFVTKNYAIALTAVVAVHSKSSSGLCQAYVKLHSGRMDTRKRQVNNSISFCSKSRLLNKVIHFAKIKIPR